MPIMYPLLINDHFVTNVNGKTNHFNDFFASQCSLINRNNKLSLNRVSITTSMSSSVNVNEPDISNILKSLDATKAYRHNDISIKILKLPP